MRKKKEELVRRAVQESCEEIVLEESREEQCLAAIHHRIAGKERSAGMMKRKNHKKVAVLVAAAVLVLGSITAFAAGKVMSITSHTYKGDAITDLEEFREEAQAALGAQIGAPESLGDGYAFEEGYVTEAFAEDGEGNQLYSFMTVMAGYGQGSVLSISIENAASDDAALWGTADAEQEPGTVLAQREIDGIPVTVKETNYLFLPPDGKPDEEDAALQRAGELVISYGSPEAERKTFRTVSWTKDGMNYLLSTFADIDAETLLICAEQVIAQQ
ncbi:MAG: hypothetical protein Q4C60_06170 [Eubacteriales bacterium]|nr:hypothetical protein [Eubacteriales bacterium]